MMQPTERLRAMLLAADANGDGTIAMHECCQAVDLLKGDLARLQVQFRNTGGLLSSVATVARPLPRIKRVSATWQSGERQRAHSAHPERDGNVRHLTPAIDGGRINRSSRRGGIARTLEMLPNHVEIGQENSPGRCHPRAAEFGDSMSGLWRCLPDDVRMVVGLVSSRRHPWVP